MSDQEIKPRWDENGVPRCEIDVPCGLKQFAGVLLDCDIDGNTMACGEICPHAVKRMAVELDAWRSRRFRFLHSSGVSNDAIMDMETNDWFNTIDEAVDALMEEEVTP